MKYQVSGILYWIWRRQGELIWRRLHHERGGMHPTGRQKVGWGVRALVAVLSQPLHPYFRPIHGFCLPSFLSKDTHASTDMCNTKHSGKSARATVCCISLNMNKWKNLNCLCNLLNKSSVKDVNLNTWTLAESPPWPSLVVHGNMGGDEIYIMDNVVEMWTQKAWNGL